jgi:acetyl esterase/lipase
MKTQKRQLISLILAAFLVFSCAAPVEDDRRPLSPPSGYRSETTMKIAYALGRLKLVDRKPEVPDDVLEIKNIEYKKADTISLQLDIYKSKKASEEPAPALIFVHGGAWKTGKRSDYMPYLIDYARKGYVAITVSYRLSKVAKFPAAVQDVACAVRWVKSQAQTYGIDPERIALLGGSAGGHLSMLVGYAGDKDIFSEGCAEELKSFDTSVRAVVNLYGPADLTTDEAKQRNEPNGFLGATYEENPDLWETASPRFHIHKHVPPTLIFHGTIDTVVPVDQSDKLAQWLRSARVPYDYHRLKGWPHAMDLSVKVNEYCQFYMDRFLKIHLEKDTLMIPPFFPSN